VSKESESYRLQILRRLERERDGPPPSEMLEAEKVITEFRKKQSNARDAIIRLRSPLPKENLCPKCYFLHGYSVDMEPRYIPIPITSILWSVLNAVMGKSGN